MCATLDSDNARRLDAEQQQDWYAFAALLTMLPGALDSHMQREGGVGHFDYLVLSALSLSADQTLRMSHLAYYAGASLSRLSNVVTKLERNGLVRRAPDPDDGRATLAILTDEGLEKVTGLAPAHAAEVLRLVFDPLTQAQQRSLRAISNRILGAIDGHDAPD